MIRKTVIATLIGLSAISISQANDNVDMLYERLTQQDADALTALTTLAQDNDPQVFGLYPILTIIKNVSSPIT